MSIDKKGVVPDIAVELPKDNEENLVRKGLLGDPETDEEDAVTTKSAFNWKERNGATPADPATTATEEDGEATEEGGDTLFGSAAKKSDEDTTAPQPKKVIPVDLVLFPDAASKEPAAEEKKKPENVIDYQLEVALRLMNDHLNKGLDFYAAEAGMPKDAATTATASIAAAE